MFGPGACLGRRRTVSLMQSLHLLVELLVVGGLIEYGDSGQERTWDLCQWMEEAPVEAERRAVG